MNCPICNKAGLPENTSRCPQCDSDLSGLLLIKTAQQKHQTIENENIKTDKKLKVLKKYRLVLMSVFSLLFVLGIIFFLRYKKEQDIKYVQNNRLLNSQIDSLQTANQNKTIKINELENVIKNKPKSQEIKYCVRKGDNLWTIASFFYNNPHKHSKIYEDNKDILEKGLFTGDTIIIKFDN